MVIGFDTETWLIQPGISIPRLVCGSWAMDETQDIEDTCYSKEEHRLTDPSETWFRFRAFLERGEHLTGVNIAYDIAAMSRYDPSLLPLIIRAANNRQFHDSAIREALHDIAGGKLFQDYKTGKSFAKRDQETGEMSGRYSMKILWERHFGEDISAEKTGDSWRFKYASLRDIPLSDWPTDAREYPIRDAERHLKIHHAQEGHQNLHDEPAQVKASIAIAFMCAWGLRTDRAWVAKLEGDVESVWLEAQREFSKVGIFRHNGTKDTKRLGQLVSEAYQGNPPKLSTGRICTDRDTLMESGDATLIKLASTGKNDKRRSTYLPILKRGVDVPLNPQFNLLVETGRVSSDMQQLPQTGGIREAFVARPGTVFASLDYSGLELRTMSQRCIYAGYSSKMAELLNTGADVHTYVAAYFEGVTYESMLTRVKAKEPKAIAYRRLAKIFNFGQGGGLGAAGLAYQARVKEGVRFCLLSGRATECGKSMMVARIQGMNRKVCSVCVAVSKEFGNRWLRAWPEQARLFRAASKITNAGPTTVTIFGSNRVRGDVGYTQYLNTPFQGAGGDGCKAAMWSLFEQTYGNRRSVLWGTRTVLNIHDELLLEIPWDRRQDAAFEASRLMVEAMNKVTPDVTNEVEPAIMRRLFKSATAAYDKQGVLKPYWPKDWAWEPDRQQMEMDHAS